MNHIFKDDPEIADLIVREEERLENTVNLIAAENHCPRSVMEVAGSVFNTKTIEGYPGNRFHAGCKYADMVELLAIRRAQELFGAEYANVQPHSGTSANLVVYFSVLDPGDRILSMSLAHGGHLSHGHNSSITGKCFDFKHYTVDRSTGYIDYDSVRRIAMDFRPKMIVAGASSYPRLIDYKRMQEIAGEVSAYLLVDMAHLAGLVAAKIIPSPVPYSDFVTFTCYKTMMGGRGGVILARKNYSRNIDRTVFPGCQGTSPVNLIAAKALVFKLAREPGFVEIQRKTLELAVLMGQLLAEKGYTLVTGGTENHQVLVDLAGKHVSGRQAETWLENSGIVLNRNVVPADAGNPGKAGGIRIGTGAVAARGMGEPEITHIADLIDQVLRHREDDTVQGRVRDGVRELCRRFPIYRDSVP
jgi:glycine hydroxymethyltransferase